MMKITKELCKAEMILRNNGAPFISLLGNMKELTVSLLVGWSDQLVVSD